MKLPMHASALKKQSLPLQRLPIKYMLQSVLLMSISYINLHVDCGLGVTKGQVAIIGVKGLLAELLENSGASLWAYLTDSNTLPTNKE